MATARASKKLATYNAKRDFARTPEPAGGDEPAPGARFVVQRHRARRLHYDLRLEIDGVMPSWAVPKGPSLDPKARLLAVRTEDHPIEYADFEGVIPAGEYGGGDVIVWDRGTYQLDKGSLEEGELHFDLFGEKLVGRFVLIRRDRDRAGGQRAGKEQWLLLHKRDELAQPGWDPEDHPRSVKSGRTNDEVRDAPAALWHSDRPVAEAEQALTWAAPTPDELAALDALSGTRPGRWTFQGRTLALTNLDKVLFPAGDGEPAVTKRDLIRYHACIAPTMLAYFVDRPLNSHRYPGGVDTKGFWHKELPDHAPEWIRRWRNPDAASDETQLYAVVDSPPVLAWLANFASVELHPWTSTTRDTHEPTWAYIDLDPGTTTSFEEILVLARLHRTALEHLGVEARPKVTGQRGIQIWIPVARGYRFDATRAWVESLSRAVGAVVPELISWKWRKDERAGLARLDYTQNAINRTLVAPYSARPRPGAPVSVPIEWDELDDPDLRPDRWTVRTVLDRVATAGDPLAPLIGRQQRLPDL